jgi:hypothetical protein
MNAGAILAGGPLIPAGPDRREDAMTQELREIRDGERFTVALDAGSPLPAGDYRVLDSHRTPDGSLEYRVRAEADGGVHVVRQDDLRFFNRILR